LIYIYFTASKIFKDASHVNIHIIIKRLKKKKIFYMFRSANKNWRS